MLEGCGRREPKGATKGVSTPLGEAGTLLSCPFKLRAQRATDVGDSGPFCEGRSTPCPLGTPGMAAAGNVRAGLTRLPRGEARLGFAAFAVMANEILPPSPSPRVSGRGQPARVGPVPPALGRQRQELSLEGGQHVERRDSRRGPERRPARFPPGAPGGAAEARGCLAPSCRRDRTFPDPSTGTCRCDAVTPFPALPSARHRSV